MLSLAVHYTLHSVQDCTIATRGRVSTVPHAGLRNRREMHNVHAQADGLASVANVSALLLHPSVINQTFSWQHLVKRSDCSQATKIYVYLHFVCRTTIQ